MDKVVTTIDASGGVLVGHDGSAAVGPGGPVGGQARRRGSAARCTSCAPGRSPRRPRPSTWSTGYVPPLTDFEEAVLDRLARRRRRARSSRRAPTSPATCCTGSAGRRLVESSARAEMLVVGSRGIGGFRGLVMGSTAGQVVGHAHCPVVVVPVHGDLDGQPADLDAGLRED